MLMVQYVCLMFYIKQILDNKAVLCWGSSASGQLVRIVYLTTKTTTAVHDTF
jgi:hypothetical protein